MIGGQPLVLPNGNVVVPLDNASETALGYTVSTNGGVEFGTALSITPISAAVDPGGIRRAALPSPEIAGGKIYVVWEDCRFRANCTSNDLVYVTSTNGTTWSAVRVGDPIDAGHQHRRLSPPRRGRRRDGKRRIGHVLRLSPTSTAASSCQLGSGTSPRQRRLLSGRRRRRWQVR